MTPTDAAPGAPHEITLEEYRRLTRGGKRARRADVPRAPRDESTGLTALLKAGWSVESPDCVRYRLYQAWGARLDTGLRPSLREACDEAKRLTREAL